MKNMLIASFDLEVGGVERSLISMLQGFDFDKYDVDLMLYHHQGEFMKLLTNKVNLLPEIPTYATFRKSIGTNLKQGHLLIGTTRFLAKVRADILGKMKGYSEPGYYQMQLMWKYALPFLPKLEKEYDIAISYLWPHYFVAEKVDANLKIAWIHTDFSTVDTDIKMDIRMWNQFDQIIAVSTECKNAFIKKYPELSHKVMVIENIKSPDMVKTLGNAEIANNPLGKDKRFKIITVARLSYAKGIDNAVLALRLLMSRGYHDIVWYVVGYGGDEEIIRQLIKENKLEENFILLGKQANPYPFMKAADIYVQPSRYEGKAVTVGEAQILEKPVLITNYPTAKSQVEDGVDGIIYDLSITGIAEGIEYLYNHPEQQSKLAENCKRKNYHNTDELQKLYKIM